MPPADSHTNAPTIRAIKTANFIYVFIMLGSIQVYPRMASNGGPCTFLDIRASQGVRSSQRFMEQLKGIHHVTAITGDAQRNLRFYSELLGQRLVKKTVNFDDPGSYHLYYGDRSGTPGTLITFFVWPGAGKGRRGVGE